MWRERYLVVERRSLPPAVPAPNVHPSGASSAYGKRAGREKEEQMDRAENALQIVRDWLDALNRSDWDGFTAALDPEIAFVFHARGETFRGVERVLGSYAAGAASSQHSVERSWIASPVVTGPPSRYDGRASPSRETGRSISPLVSCCDCTATGSPKSRITSTN
jgi:hypothetical protein